MKHISTFFYDSLCHRQFATLETRRKLGRINFRKDSWDRYKGQGRGGGGIGQQLTGTSPVTIPQTIGHISAPIPFPILKWRMR